MKWYYLAIKVISTKFASWAQSFEPWWWNPSRMEKQSTIGDVLSTIGKQGLCNLIGFSKLRIISVVFRNFVAAIAELAIAFIFFINHPTDRIGKTAAIGAI